MLGLLECLSVSQSVCGLTRLLSNSQLLSNFSSLLSFSLLLLSSSKVFVVAVATRVGISTLVLESIF